LTRNNKEFKEENSFVIPSGNDLLHVGCDTWKSYSLSQPFTKGEEEEEIVFSIVQDNLSTMRWGEALEVMVHDK
jgi:hypothetical protein